MNNTIEAQVNRITLRRKRRITMLKQLRFKKQKLNDFYTAVAEFDAEEHPVEYGQAIVHSPNAAMIRKILKDQRMRVRTLVKTNP